MAVIGTDRLIDKVKTLEYWTINSEQQIRDTLKLNDNYMDLRLVLDSKYNPRVFEVTQKALVDFTQTNQEPIS